MSQQIDSGRFNKPRRRKQIVTLLGSLLVAALLWAFGSERVRKAIDAFRGCPDCTVLERLSLSRDAFVAPAFFGDLREIIDGRPAFQGEFPGVAAILVDQKVACTASVVGDHSLLTAAHCFFDDSGRVLDVARLRITFDRNAIASQNTIPVAAFRYPLSSDGFGFSYDFETNTDDVGVLHVKAPFESSYRRHGLYAGNPPASWWQQRAIEFPVVGYGISLSDGTGVGIQRTAMIPIRRVDSRRFNFYKESNATCNGDSGGPALTRNKKSVIAITSTTIDCQESFASRVDVYRPWIAAELKRIKNMEAR